MGEIKKHIESQMYEKESIHCAPSKYPCGRGDWTFQFRQSCHMPSTTVQYKTCQVCTVAITKPSYSAFHTQF